MWKRDWETKRKNTVVLIIDFVIKPKRNIQEQISSNFADDNFLQHKPVHFHSLVIWIYFSICLIH